MAEFEIAPDKARHSAGELKSCSNKLKSYGNQVESTVNSLRQLGDSTEYIKTALRAILEDIRKQQQEADDFSEKLKRIVTLYQSAEKEIGAYAAGKALKSVFAKKPEGKRSAVKTSAGAKKPIVRRPSGVTVKKVKQARAFGKNCRK